jgi:type I restriction enzyme S subunit
MITATKNTKPFYNTEIPGDWEIKPLFEVGKIVTGNTPSRAENTYWNGDICWATAQDFNDKYIFDTIEKVTKEGASVARILPVGSVLVTCIASIGNNALAAVPMATNQQINSIIPKKEYHNEWIYYYLSYSKQRLEILSGKTAVPIITKGAFGKFKIPLPPLPEQKAIAQVLSAADASIHTTEKLIAQKELRKKWLMQQLLTGKKRLKGFDGEWKEMHLGEMFTERNDTKYFNLPLLSIGQNGVYPQDESIKKDTSNEDKSKYKRICPGDIGYNTMRMWQGRSALSDLEGIVSPAYTVVTPKKDADSLFFSYLFKMPKMTNLFWRNSQGLVDDTLNCKFKDFSIVKVVLPQTIEEQTAIAQVLQASDKEISLLKAKAGKLSEQKKGLMQQLLTGKVRLKIN